MLSVLTLEMPHNLYGLIVGEANYIAAHITKISAGSWPTQCCPTYNVPPAMHIAHCRESARSVQFRQRGSVRLRDFTLKNFLQAFKDARISTESRSKFL